MFNNKKLFSVLFFVSVASVFAQKQTTEEYIRLYKDIAIKNMQLKKIPASITLAQGILESGNGNSTLATKAYNHFGIKCHKGWEGGTYYIDDDAPNECFRKYKSVLDSYEDHADFLSTRERYNGLFMLEITDYKGWANGLKAAGYATSLTYATSLIDLIEKYKLYDYDQQALDPVFVVNNTDNNNTTTYNNNNSNSHKAKLIYVNGLKAIKVQKGKTKDVLATEFELKVKQIERFNEIGAADPLFEGELIFLEPLRNSAEPAYKIHEVKAGETFYSIAHQYGIKTQSLMKKNNMWYGSIIKPGDKLNLRKKKPLSN